MEGSSSTSIIAPNQDNIDQPAPKRIKLYLNPQSADIEVLQLKVLLKGSKPPIWRRIRIPSFYTFKELHKAANKAMGWKDKAWHGFIYENRTEGITLHINQSTILTSDDRLAFLQSTFKSVLETNILVGDVFKNAKDYVHYTYDFVNGWIHKIILEEKSVTKRCDLKKFPLCLTGRRACPPENCGGLNSYYTILQLIESKDKSHPKYKYYKEVLEKMGFDFDPASFDRDMVFKTV